MPGGMWVWPVPWRIAAICCGMVAVGAACVALMRLLGRGFVASWLAVALAGFAVGVAADAGFLVQYLPDATVRSALSITSAGDQAAAGALGGCCTGGSRR